jgi:hypothetical protein
MATEPQLREALKNAHEAGDVKAARKLATAIKNGEYEEVDFDFGEMVSNIPSSGKQYVKDLAYPILNPVDAAKGLYKMASGGVQKLIPGEQGNEPYADAVGEFFKNRYGSVDRFQNTAMKDPVGVLADASGLISGGASLVPKAGGIAKVARAADPAVLAANLTRKGLGKIVPEKKPIEMMSSAVKWNTKTPRKTKESMARTMLDEGILPNYQGLEKAEKTIVSLNSQIDGLIDEATKSGRTIPRSRVFRHLKEARQKAIEGGNPKTELKQINAFAKDLNETWRKYDMKEFTPKQLQEFKKDMYKLTDFDAANLKSGRGTNAARKQAGRAARENLEKIAPEIRALNAREGKLYELMDQLPQKAQRIENRNAISFNMAPTTGLGLGLDYLLGTPGVGAAIGFGASAMDMPMPKARNALTLHRLKNAGLLDAPIGPHLASQGLFNLGRQEDY